MASLKYSDILADILSRNHSRCICPVGYLAGIKAQDLKRPETEECQFGPGCNFKTTCQFDKTKCTCHLQCTCGLEIPPSVSTIEARNKPGITNRTGCCTSQKPSLSKNSYTGMSDFSLLPLPNCDKTICTCSNNCICLPQKSSPELFPSCLQNVIKKQVNNKVCDELIKKECDEIKQLIKEHKEITKIKTEINKEPYEKSEREVKRVSEPTSKVNDSTKNSLIESEQTSLSKNRKTSAQNAIDTTPESRKSILKPTASPDISSNVSKKEAKNNRRRKVPKKLYPVKTNSMAVRNNYYCGCQDYSKRRPPRIRYYYAGSTENYGSKVGHKNCVVPPVSVPKHMGWLWNKEDPSKGIRERKGWPPGFIAKNIKHMMKVMKSFEAEAESAREGAEMSIWKSVEFTEELAPEIEEPPLLHIHKKGRTYNITFCPKESDEDLCPIPIPFSITEKKQEDDSSTTDSSLEFELHSPKPKGKYPKMVRKIMPPTTAKTLSQTPSTEKPPESSTKQGKKKGGLTKKKKSKSSEENRINWEEQTTQMQNIT